VLLALVTVAPIVASYFAYYIWRPESFRNYGELIAVTSLNGVPAAEPQASSPFDSEPLKGHWVILMVDSGNCAGNCKGKLWQMRQVRLTQGKDMDRVIRAWLVDDSAAPAPELMKEYEGTLVIQAKGSPLIAKLPAGEGQRDHLFLVDPLGNLMMRFPKDADPSKIKKDLIHLLKVSRIG
jgi:cytochrome oxidase Cu insertion factor (SCO1/SenC/PrrC family)